MMESGLFFTIKAPPPLYHPPPPPNAAGGQGVYVGVVARHQRKDILPPPPLSFVFFRSALFTTPYILSPDEKGDLPPQLLLLLQKEASLPKSQSRRRRLQQWMEEEVEKDLHRLGPGFNKHIAPHIRINSPRSPDERSGHALVVREPERNSLSHGIGISETLVPPLLSRQNLLLPTHPSHSTLNPLLLSTPLSFFLLPRVLLIFPFPF